MKVELADGNTYEIHCPFCGEDVVESTECFMDYDVVGSTYRCIKCGKGFGMLME